MQPIPKLVRDRLKSEAPVVNHPDADVLAAFSERSLPDLERDIVLEHLARCGECREIVALALPESESVQVVLSPSRGWLAWPTLRWAFVAAGVIVVASFGVIQYRRQSAPTMVAYKAQPAAAISADEPPTNQKSVAMPESRAEQDKGIPVSAPASRSDREPRLAEKKSVTATTPPPPAAVSGAGGGIGGVVGGPLARGALAHGPRMLNQQQQLNANAFQQQKNFQLDNSDKNAATLTKQEPANAPSANAPGYGPVRVDAQAAEVPTKGRDLDAVAALKSEPVPLRPLSGGAAEVVVNRAKDPGTIVVSNERLPGGTVPTGSALSSLVDASPARWTINAFGMLQYSVDQGNTWHDASVNGSSGEESAGAAITAKASAPKAKESSRALKRDGVPFVFRAVASNGPDVWAGGSAGMLYHSTDSGATWTRVFPASSGIALSGDIVSLDFPDPQNGKITTSTPEVWITSDAGQTWQKQ
jgi:hypothetical protein